MGIGVIEKVASVQRPERGEKVNKQLPGSRPVMAREAGVEDKVKEMTRSRGADHSVLCQ